MLSKADFLIVLDKIGQLFPEAHGELVWDTPFHLLLAVTLSAQTTDKSVNKATPALFARYPRPEDLAVADLAEVENYIRTIGLYKTKTKHIVATAQMLVEHYGSKIPEDKTELQKLPGVGRKTANVVMAEGFGVPGIAVDTHVERVTKRLGLVAWDKSVVEVEEKLMRTLPKKRWIKAHHQLIFFGRYHCLAKKPKCAECPVVDRCQFKEKNL